VGAARNRHAMTATWSLGRARVGAGHVQAVWIWVVVFPSGFSRSQGLTRVKQVLNGEAVFAGSINDWSAIFRSDRQREALAERLPARPLNQAESL
jgi:hypothetical protein